MSTLTANLSREDARLDGVIAKRATLFAASKPDKKHGEAVFAATCTACHRLHGNGGLVGPNLDGIRSRGVHRLIEDILDPNRNVDPLFHQVVIETKDGQSLSGMNPREEGGKLVFADIAGQPQSIAMEPVKAKMKSALSLMPA